MSSISNEVAQAASVNVQQSQPAPQPKQQTSQSSQSNQQATTQASPNPEANVVQSTATKQDSNNGSGSNEGSDQQSKQDAIKRMATSDSPTVDLEFTELRFSVHERTNRVSVQVVDKGSEEVIKEIPSEKVLDMLGAMWDAAGLFVDAKH